MTGKTHQSLGLLAVSTFFLTQTKIEYAPATLGAVLVASYFGALLPDIDQPAGKLWHDIPVFGKTLGKLSDPFLEHRNITHSLLGFILVGIGLYFFTRSFPSYWGINQIILFASFMVAYASHLLADMFTVQGIPLLYPYHRMFGIPPRPFESFRMHTGKWFENLILFPIVNLATLLLVYFNWHIIKLIIFK